MHRLYIYRLKAFVTLFQFFFCFNKTVGVFYHEGLFSLKNSLVSGVNCSFILKTIIKEFVKVILASKFENRICKQAKTQITC